MKLFSSDIKEKLKKELRDNKNGFVFTLALIIVLNICSGYVKAKHESVIDETEQLIASCQAMDKEPFDGLGTLFLPNDSDETEIMADTDGVEETSANGITTGLSKYTEEELKLIADKIMKYFSYADDSLEKKEFLETVVTDSFRELIDKDTVNEEQEEEVLVEEGNDEEITLANFDTASLEQKIAFICEKYDLTDYEFKVVFSVLCHEAGWYYDDAFKVTTILYNRINSKESIRYIHYLTKNVTEHGGDNLYSQVIATSYTKDGKKIRQFDGYISDVAGYDFEQLLDVENIEVKLNGFLDCLILLKLGEDYENPAFPLAPCFAKIRFWGDGKRNHFSDSISTSDAVEDYNYPYSEYNKEFTREEVIEMAKEYIETAKKRVK